MATTDNLHETLAREKKCRILAAWFYDEFIHTLQTATNEMWIASAAKAGTRVPSQESRELIVTILKERRP